MAFALITIFMMVALTPVAPTPEASAAARRRWGSFGSSYPKILVQSGGRGRRGRSGTVRKS